MIRNFKHRGLQRLFERGDRSKIRPDLLAKVERVLARLDASADPKDMDAKVKVGWVKGLNRLYFLYEAYDNYWDFSRSDLHNDMFEIVVDGDASGGPLIDAMHNDVWNATAVGEMANRDARIDGIATIAQATWRHLCCSRSRWPAPAWG